MLLEQVRGIEAWVRTHGEPDGADAKARSRQLRLDLTRRRDVVERQRQALIDQTTRHLLTSVHPLCSRAATRTVLAHRNAWFKGQVISGLQAGGVSVVADLDNGADAVGVVAAEQPDLLLMEGKLPMLSGPELTVTVREYAPTMIVVVQVVDEWEIGPLLAAGATAVYTRRVPPADVAAGLLELLGLRAVQTADLAVQT